MEDTDGGKSAERTTNVTIYGLTAEGAAEKAIEQIEEKMQPGVKIGRASCRERV